MNAAAALGSLAIAAAMSAAGSGRRVSPGYGLWIIGAVALSASQLLLALQGGDTPSAVFVLTNALILLRFALDTAGLERFAGREPAWLIHAIGVGLAAVVSAVFTFVVPAPPVRAAVMSSLAAGWTFWSLAIVVRDVPRVIGTPPRLAVVAFSLEGLWTGVRIVHMSVSAALGLPFTGSTPLYAVYFLLFIGIGTVTAFALTSLHTRRVEIELLAAQAEAAALRGVVPTCPSCRRVREGAGWAEIVELARRRREEEPAQGMCPECSARVYARR